jgi:hypothetical protein
MYLDVVAKDLGEYPLVLELPIDGCVMQPHAGLHHLVLGQVGVVVGTLDLVQDPNMPIVSLNLLTRLTKLAENLVKYQ